MRLSLTVLLAGLWTAAAASPSLAEVRFGNVSHGAALIRQIGCGSCHIIPGIDNAHGLVGPPLDHMSRRIFIAGLLRNTPDNMMDWLMHPQKIVPGNAMPDMDLGSSDARDIAAYLAQIR